MLKSSPLNLQACLHIYCMMDCPLTYAAPVWRHATLTYIHKLQIAQNRAARTMIGQPRDRRIAQLHGDLSLPLLTDYTLIRSHDNFGSFPYIQ